MSVDSGPLSLEFAFDAFLNKADKISDQQQLLIKRSAKPLHYPIVGSVVGATGTATIMSNQAPDSGRIWELERFSLFGADGHTALTTVPAVTQPAVPASTVAQQNVNQFPVQVVISAGTITAVVVNGVTVGSGAGTYTVPANGSISITYTVAPTWVWTALSTSGALADVYAASSPLVVPDMSAQIFSGLAIPSTTYPPDESEWLHYGEQLIVVAFGLPANSQVVFVARIADWPMEAVESLELA